MTDEAAPITEAAAPTPEAEAPATEPVKAEAPGTLLEDAGTDPAPKGGEFPDDWREKLAGEDAATLNLLKRLGSPADMVRKLAEQEKLIRSGKHKAPLGADASPEELAEYRKANGVPEAPDGYVAALDGLVIGDEDKADIDAFFAKAHAENLPPAAVKLAVNQFFEMQQAKAERMAEQDKEFRQGSIDQLREAMGADYRGNMNDLKSWLGSREGMLEAFSSARGADGRLLGDNPAVINFLVSQMREINPLSTVVGSGTAGVEGLKAEIAKLKTMMRENPKEYWQQANQDRYKKLLEAEEKMDARAA